MLKIKGLDPAITSDAIPHTPVIVGYRGSIAHGMYVPSDKPNSTDDKDIMAVVIAPINNYFGLQNFEGKDTFEGEYDIVTYEIRKFFRLLIKNNPNVLSLLWLNNEHYIYSSNIGNMIIDNRHLFSSRLAYYSFTGYAHGQLHRMTHHTKQGYMGKKRRKLVDKFGYDPKAASHLIRLLIMGIEFINTGHLYVNRGGIDAPQLLEIKNGEWTLDRVKDEADRLFKRAEDAFDRSPLPVSPNVEAIEILLVDALRNIFL